MAAHSIGLDCTQPLLHYVINEKGGFVFNISGWVVDCIYFVSIAIGVLLGVGDLMGMRSDD